jgi:hypothetical protein
MLLSGYKTYITAAVAIIGAVAGYLVGDVSLADTAQLVLTAVLGATIRSGIASK